MGYYTEFKFKSRLKKDTPQQVIDLLKRVIIDGDFGLGDKVGFDFEDVFIPEIKHDFFKCERWYMIFASYYDYTDKTLTIAKMFEDNGHWVIELHSDINYESNEIKYFVDWITPYLYVSDRAEVGYWRPEGTLIELGNYPIIIRNNQITIC
jgi:hypothetical protein